MSDIKNVGNSVKGHVLDMNPVRFEQMLRRYDDRLYLKWNPRKNKGYGVWEVRRRPSTKTPVYRGLWVDGTPVWEPQYVEQDLVHHVLDAPILDMRVIHKLYEMDTFRFVDKGSWYADLEYRIQKKEEADAARYTDDLRHQIRENKKYYKQLKDLVEQGYNPAWFYSSHRK